MEQKCKVSGAYGFLEPVLYRMGIGRIKRSLYFLISPVFAYNKYAAIHVICLKSDVFQLFSLCSYCMHFTHKR
jgi:hypothetical protein